MRIVAGGDAPADVLAQAQVLRGGLANPLVQFAGFRPQAELAGADVAVHALGGGTDAGQFVVVYGARAVHRDVVDGAAFQQVDDVPVDAAAQHVSSHHQDPRGSPAAGLLQPFGDRRQDRGARTPASGRRARATAPAAESWCRSASGLTSRRERSKSGYRVIRISASPALHGTGSWERCSRRPTPISRWRFHGSGTWHNGSSLAIPTVRPPASFTSSIST